MKKKQLDDSFEPSKTNVEIKKIEKNLSIENRKAAIIRSISCFLLRNHDADQVIAAFGYLFLGINLTTNLFFILS